MWKPETIAADNLRRVDVALHEWIGLIEYKLKGYSDQWFPAPTGEEERVTAQFLNRSPSNEIGIARAPRISELVGRSFFPGPLAGSPSGRNDFSVALVQLLVNDPMSVGLFLGVGFVTGYTVREMISRRPKGIEQCPRLRAKRKTYARTEFFRVCPTAALGTASNAMVGAAACPIGVPPDQHPTITT